MPNKEAIRFHILFSMLRLCLIVILFVFVSLLLATRPLYTAPDDQSYIEYFDQSTISALTDASLDFWLDFLNEPLWNIYSAFIGSLVEGETGIRVTIFLATLMYLAFATKLSRGACLFVLAVFVIDSSLATQMYYNQIRQGLALSFFLMLTGIGLAPIWAAIVASGIHSSFLVVIPCAIAARVIGKRKIFLIISTIAIAAGAFSLGALIENVDLGRRSEIYEFVGKFNMVYYTFAAIQYGLVFYLTKSSYSDEQQSAWYTFCLIFTVLAFVLSFIHEAGGRLMYIGNTIITIMIARNMKLMKGRLVSYLWLFLLLVLIFSEGRKLGFTEDTWFGRWMIIFS